MEKQFRVETLLDGELAGLYQEVLAEFERAGGLSLSDVNRSLLQTGMLLHLTMMTSMGVVRDPERRRVLDGLVERVGREHLMWEVVDWARRHWRGPGGGAVDLQA